MFKRTPTHIYKKTHVYIYINMDGCKKYSNNFKRHKRPPLPMYGSQRLYCMGDIHPNQYCIKKIPFNGILYNIN